MESEEQRNYLHSLIQNSREPKEYRDFTSVGQRFPLVHQLGKIQRSGAFTLREYEHLLKKIQRDSELRPLQKSQIPRGKRDFQRGQVTNRIIELKSTALDRQ